MDTAGAPGVGTGAEHGREQPVYGALADGISTADLGGTADTAGYTRAVLDRVGAPAGVGA